MFASSRPGNNPIHLCISNLADMQKELAEVCYMNVNIDTESTDATKVCIQGIFQPYT